MSGGSTNTITTTTTTSATISNSINTTFSSQRTNPEYIKLSVYGLQEPDEEMKQDLCKNLQSELDYWLLIRMCNSIEKNTYKTTSLQHPDKITEEDLTFFKQMCDNYFDVEILLPFVFNFNKTMRENFFYFAKQIFNSNFKAIDAIQPTTGLTTNISNNQLKRTSSMIRAEPVQTSEIKDNESDDENDFDELNNLLNSDDLTKQGLFGVPQTLGSKTPLFCSKTTQPVSSMFTQQSFSYMAMQPSLGPFEAQKLASSASSLLQSSSSLAPKKAENDPFSIMLTRILFQNSKNIRIGKHSVSLVLVEALYSVKGLEYLVTSKITRSNSNGSNNLPSNLNSSQQLAAKQSQVLETSYTQTKKTGPTFVFRFYCRGENDTNAYLENLKTALNDAMLYFLSEYLTKIEPELYLKTINLKKKPALFRITNCEFKENLIDDNDKLKNRKRHKSMGNEKLQEMKQQEARDNRFILKMNRSARETKLGKILLNNKIVDENQLGNFILNNFSNNLFDHRDYEDTIEYFRESIKAFDYSRILNNLGSYSLNSLSYLTFDLGDENESENESSNSSSSISSTSSIGSLLQKEQRSLSIETTNESSAKSDLPPRFDLSNKSDQTDVEQIKKEIKCRSLFYQKSYLRILYDWLRGLYSIQMRNGVNTYSKPSCTLSSSLSASQSKLPVASQQAWVIKQNLYY